MTPVPIDSESEFDGAACNSVDHVFSNAVIELAVAGYRGFHTTSARPVATEFRHDGVRDVIAHGPRPLADLSPAGDQHHRTRGLGEYLRVINTEIPDELAA